MSLKFNFVIEYKGFIIMNFSKLGYMFGLKGCFFYRLLLLLGLEG